MATVWPSWLKVNRDRPLSHSSTRSIRAAATRRPPLASTPACPAEYSSSRWTPAGDSPAMISITRVLMPVRSAARTACKDSNTVRVKPTGYDCPSSPIWETSTGTACSRSRYQSYPPRCWPTTIVAASASASGTCPSTAATSAAPASSRPVRPARTAKASSALNSSTGMALPRSVTGGRLLVISTLAVPPTGTNGRTTSGSDTSSNTRRHWSPSASSQFRTVAPVSLTSRPESPLGSPTASATAASPVSRLLVSAPLTQATSRQPAASFARA